MAKPRKPIPAKLRAALQQEIGSACPICTNTDVGHFDVHHIDENPENNEPSNLLMLCKGCHSKITKGEISATEAKGIKRTLVNIGAVRAQPMPTQTYNFHGSIGNAVIGSGNTINNNQPRKTTKQKYPPGCIGHNAVQANYVSYLIDRFHEYKEWEVGKENMRWGLFPSQLKKKFKVGTQRTIYNLPDTRFDELCIEIQRRIEGTKFGRMKKGSQRLFSSFEQYLEEQGP